MKKEELAAVILAVLLIFAPLVGGIVQNFVHGDWNHPTGGDNNEQQQQIQGWATLAVAVLTFFVLVFQAWIYHGQSELMNRQTVIMERQTLMQTEVNRPHIVVVGIEASNESPEWMLLSVVWQNSGQIPPTDFRTVMHMTTSDNPELKFDTKFVYGKNHVPGPLIARDSKIKTDAILVFVGTDKTEKTPVQDNWIFIWGEAQYLDRLSPGVVHCVEYCFRGHKGGDSIDFVPYGPYNRGYDAKQPKHGPNHNTPPA